MICPCGRSGATADRLSCTSDSWSRISKIRIPAVAARGTIITIQPRPRIGICSTVRNIRNIVSSPTVKLPFTTSRPPYQIVSTIAAAPSIVISGMFTACTIDASYERCCSQPAARPNFCPSNSERPNALTTRIPDNASCSTVPSCACDSCTSFQIGRRRRATNAERAAIRIMIPQTISASGQLISSMITSVPTPSTRVNVSCTPPKLMNIRTTSTSCVARTMI